MQTASSSLRAITRESSVIMIIVTSLRITSSLQMTIQHSSPVFQVIYFIVWLLHSPHGVTDGEMISEFISAKQYKRLLLPGGFYSIMIVSHMIAISLVNVAYMISLKRTSLVMGVIYGYFFFREKNIRERLSGALLMFIGFIMIVTAP
jgi:glucose uptake protein GlcU